MNATITSSTISSLSDDELTVYLILRGRKGLENAITTERIAKMTGFTERMIRRVIKKLIEEIGVPIAASNRAPFGYYYPTRRKEILEYRATLVHRISSLARRLRAYDRVTARAVQQALDLFDEVRL